MKKFSIIVLALIFCLPPLFADEGQLCDLGPVSFIRPAASEWNSDVTLEVNHEAHFVHRTSGDQIRIRFYVPTEFEKNLGGPAAMTRFVRENVEMPIYCRYLESQDLILLIHSEKAGPETRQLLQDLIQSLQVNENFMLSPCVRIGMIQNQFQKMAEMKSSCLTSYASSLKKELERRIAQGDRHCFGPLYYFLGHLACYNRDWQFMGKGFNRGQAIDFFRKAEEARSRAQEPGNALKLLSR